jgi:hypothetical protein
MGRQTTNSSRQPNVFVRKAAQAYNEKYRFGRIIEDLYVAVDVSRARRIADAYEALPIDDSGNPAVRTAYLQLAEEIEQQWTFAIENIEISFQAWPREGQPYANSFEMFWDVSAHRHLFFFQGGDPHPYLRKIDPKTGFSPHDKFRAIHDLFGHAAEGYGFGPRGEENAWIKHSQMFSAEAQKAITTETRGHNSWVNFGQHNYDSTDQHTNRPLAKRPYAIQKAALLPDEFSDFSVFITKFKC